MKCEKCNKELVHLIIFNKYVCNKCKHIYTEEEIKKKEIRFLDEDMKNWSETRTWKKS